MLRLLSAIAGMAVVVSVLFGTWPVLFGKRPVKPLVEPSKIEGFKDRVADGLRDFEFD